MHIYLWQIDPPIKHRSLENHYTAELSYIVQCTYSHGRLTPPLLQLSINPSKTTTPNKFHDILTPPPPPINHGSMEDHYIT